jgi:xyloglucan-specific exo-beta-1,4-glucanase
MCKKLLVFVLMFGLVSTAIAQPTGEIMYEVWSNIGGTAVSDLTGNSAYPDNPTSAELLTDFASPVDIADNFGSRIHGYLYPELSGDYTFWIASDDASELWLSTDDDPANAALLCSVSGWTSAQDWDGTTGAPGPDQMSAPVPLEGGGKYYISAIYKEGGGGDNCSVAWQGPDHPERVLLAGHHLSPAPWAASVQKAQNPVPADGAVDVDTGI